MPNITNDLLCEVTMQNKERDIALSKLSGKSFKQIKEITGINDEYYLRKILFKDIPMSGYVYLKIIPDKPYSNDLHYCARCGERLCSTKRMYCSECEEHRYLKSLIRSSEPNNTIINTTVSTGGITKKSKRLGKYSD